MVKPEVGVAYNLVCVQHVAYVKNKRVFHRYTFDQGDHNLEVSLVVTSARELPWTAGHEGFFTLQKFDEVV